MAPSDRSGGSAGLHRPAVAGILAAGMTVCLVVALVGLPREDAHLPAVARRALEVAVPGWHITEPVNEVVYGTRGFDTFGETFLLLAAVVSVMTLTRRHESRREGDDEHGEERAGRREQAEIDPRAGADSEQARARAAEQNEQPDGAGSGGVAGGSTTYPDDERLGARGPERAESMSVVTRTAGRVAAPLLAIGGVYLVAEGYSPGGGFPAGAVMLGVILMLWAGFGPERMGRAIQQRPLESLELTGALAIVAIEVLGLVIKGSVSANWLPLAKSPMTIFSGGVLQAFSGSELVEVATGLALTVFSLLAMRHDWTADEAGETDGEATGSGSGTSGKGAGGRSAPAAGGRA